MCQAGRKNSVDGITNNVLDVCINSDNFFFALLGLRVLWLMLLFSLVVVVGVMDLDERHTHTHALWRAKNTHTHLINVYCMFTCRRSYRDRETHTRIARMGVRDDKMLRMK